MRQLIFAVGVLLSPYISGSSGDATNGFDLEKPYKMFTMKNGMQGLVIQDQNATTTAATITVINNGIINSKIVQERLEFLDHLLHMGNQRLSSSTMFWEYAKNGSSPKDWSNDELRGYIFGVTMGHLEKGLEMLVRLSFCQYCEKKATSLPDHEGVSSTIDKKENRHIKVVSIPKNPYTQFIIGSLEKPISEPLLRDDLEINGSQEVYYNPPQLLVSFTGNQSLEELEMIVSKAFGDLEDDLGKESFEGWRGTWSPEFLGTISETTSQRFNRVYMNFPIPGGLQTVFEKYYAPLLRYKCRKCLWGYLHERGYAPSLSVYSHRTYRGYLSYGFIDADLGKKGFENREEVVKAIFQYIELLRRTGAQKWFWDLQHTKDYVTSWLKYNKQPDKKPEVVEFPKDKIEKVLHYLVPSKVALFVESPNFLNKTWRKIDGSLLKAISNVELNPELDLPEKLYEFPKDLEVLNVTAEESKKGPELIYTSNYTELWHKTDGKFNVPKTSVTGMLWNPSNPKSLWDTVMGSLQAAALVQCVKNITYFPYNAEEIFGGVVLITRRDGKFQVDLTGLSSAVPNTLRKIPNALINCTFQDKDFQRIIHSAKNDIISRQKQGPCGAFALDTLVDETHWSDQERLEALDSVTLHDLEEFHRRVFSQIKMKWLVYGNIVAEDAKQLIKEVEGKLTEGKPKPLRNVQLNPRYIEVAGGTRWRINMKNPSTESNRTCTILYFQSKKQTLKDSVMQDITTDLMRNLLSQEEPFGNLAQTNWGNLWYGLGSAMVVESVENPTMVETNVENFLGKFKGIDETAYASVVATKVANWERKRETFKGEDNRLFLQVYYEDPGLSFFEKQINLARNLTVEEVKEYFEGLTNKCTRGSLAFHVYGNQPAEVNYMEPSALTHNSGNLCIQETTGGDGTTGTEDCSVVKILDVDKLKEWKDQQKLLPIYNLKE